MEKQTIREYIQNQKKAAIEPDKRLWGLVLMWTDTRDVATVETRVRTGLDEAQEELKKPYDHSDAFEANWREGLERDVRVLGAIVKFLDGQKGRNNV